MGDGPILKLTSKLNLNLVCTKESTPTKDVGTTDAQTTIPV